MGEMGVKQRHLIAGKRLFPLLLLIFIILSCDNYPVLSILKATNGEQLVIKRISLTSSISLFGDSSSSHVKLYTVLPVVYISFGSQVTAGAGR